MSKGRGTVAYVDTDSDDQYYAIACLLELTPSGLSRGIVEAAPCLGDDALVQDTGDLKRTPITGTYVFTANESTIENALETVMIADTAFKMAIKLNYSTPVYLYATGKLTELKPRAITRDQKISREFEFLPTSAVTKSGTGPTLES